MPRSTTCQISYIMVNLYVASKVPAVAEWLPSVESWNGVSICSRWHTIPALDDTDPISCLELWDSTVFPDLQEADALLLYSRQGDTFKGGMAEVGAVWSQKKPVIILGSVPNAMRTLCHSGWVYEVATFDDAHRLILSLTAPD